jgi:hypothetical protein
VVKETAAIKNDAIEFLRKQTFRDRFAYLFGRCAIGGGFAFARR